MNPAEASILIVGADPTQAAECAVLFADSGSGLVHVSVGQALVELAGTNVRLCVVSEACTEAEVASVVAAAQRRGVMTVYWAHALTPVVSERAMLAGCRGVLEPAGGAGRVQAFLVAAADHLRRYRLERQDLLGLQSRYEALRKRCAQLNDRHQETQEIFFLDLSRVMTIISNIMDGIVFVNREGNVTLLNPVAEDLLGVKGFAALGKQLTSMLGRDELLKPMVADHKRVTTQGEITQTVEVHHSEQDLLYIKCITSSVADYKGQPAGVLTVLKDVTAEFKSDQLKNQYLSIVAHELRTPLTGIKTFSSMMAKGSLGSLTDSQRRVVDSIREQSLRLEHQIDKLINLGHLESDEYGQDREVFSLGDFLSGLMAPFEQPARDRQISLSFGCEADEKQELFADRADLRRACQAVVENAVKFTPNGGAVEVRIVRDQNGAPRFMVKDSGIGIDPRYQRRIFEKFFQVEDPLTRHHGGAGLGLFVANEILQAHGSAIEVSSQLGLGAEFSFMLPRHAASSSATEPAKALIQ